MTAKDIAMLDMKASGVEVKFLVNEKAILAFTATELSVRVDFRKFNGGYHPKKEKSE